MEPELKKKEFQNQKKILIIVSVLVISLFLGSSFSLLTSHEETGEVINFKTGDLNMQVTSVGTLNLNEELPKSDEDALANSEEITLTLHNNGSLEIGKYEIKLVSNGTTTLDSNCIKFSVSEDGGTNYLETKLLSETNNIIYTGYNLKEEDKTLKLKIWVAENAGEDALNKLFEGKIGAELYQNGDMMTDVVKSKLISNYSIVKEGFNGGLVGINTDGNLYHEGNNEEIREYRYSGLDVNNYITFNDEMWRIVGVFKDEKGEHLRIVRNSVLTKDMFPDTYTINGITYNIKSTTDGDYAYWNKKADGTGNNDWTTAGLQYWLNTKQDETVEKPNNGYLSYLKDGVEDLIDTTKYYLGTVTYEYVDSGNLGIKDTPKEAYANERKVECANGVGPTENNSQTAVEGNTGCRVWAENKATWEGKVGFLYPSDYGFSTESTHWGTMMKFSVFNSTGTNKSSDTSWLHKQANKKNNEWLVSPSSYGTNTVAVLANTGEVSHYKEGYVYSQYGRGVRPVLNLKSEVKITGGDGTQANPYTLEN